MTRRPLLLMALLMAAASAPAPAARALLLDPPPAETPAAIAVAPTATTGDPGDDRLLVRLLPPIERAGLTAAELDPQVSVLLRTADLRADGRLIVDDPAAAARLAGDPRVAAVERDPWVRPAFDPANPNDPLAPSQWALGAAGGGANFRGAWATATGLPSVVVALVDSGVRFDHPDIAGALLPGIDLISDLAVSNDGDGRDVDPSDPGDWVTAVENSTPGGIYEGCGAANSSWHGTKTASIVAATADNGIGLAGGAPTVRLLPVRVIGKCGGWASDLADGVRWAAGLSVSGAGANTTPAAVINLSIGGAGACPLSIASAIAAASAAGAAVVASAGNEGGEAANSFPGNCAGAIDVAALTSAGAKAAYSNSGSIVDLAAPGSAVAVASDSGANGPSGAAYATASGTSFAAPYAAAALALMRSAAPYLSSTTLAALLAASARPFAAACSGCGSGIMDAAAAVAAAVAANAPSGPGAAQAISFTLPATAAIGATIALAGSSSAGLPLVYDSLTPLSCTVSGGLVVGGRGPCAVRATAPAAGAWAAAAPVVAAVSFSDAPSGSGDAGCLLIADGADWIRHRTTDLTISPPAGASLMRLATEPTFAGAEWGALGYSAAIDLPGSGNGLAYVYAGFDDGTTCSDFISIDGVRPAAFAPARVSGFTRFTRNRVRYASFLLRWGGRDDAMGSGIAGALITTNRNAPGAVRGYSPVRITVRRALVRVYVAVVDAAGNQSAWRSILIDAR
jgi:serine protease